MNNKWHKISLAFFLCIALIGTMLRAMPLIDISFNYSYMLHAHSHLAFQGWIYTLMLLMVPELFLNREQIKKSRYALQFKLTVPLLIGILISFSMTGYSILSIVLSTIFQGLTYWFIFRFFSDSSKMRSNHRALSFVRTGFWFSMLSSIAPYFVGVLSAKNMQDSEFYESAVYFFLHFQYNGWFLFTAIGVGIKILENKGIYISGQYAKLFYQLMTVSAVLLYGHSLLGMSFGSSVLVPSLIGAILQLMALVILTKALQKLFLNEFDWIRILMVLAYLAFGLKVALQLFSHLPSAIPFVFHNRPWIMAYMHLCLIGIVSISFLAYLLELKWMNLSVLSRSGLILLVFGFFSSEIFLGILGFGYPLPNVILVVFSMLMALGILLMLINPDSKIIGSDSETE